MSNITIYRFALDMTPGGVTPVVHLSQYDEAFQLEFTLYSRSGELDIPSGATAMIEGTKLDGKAYSANATISGNVVTVAGDVQISAVAGNNPFQIVLKSGNSTVGSANFTIAVERAAMDYDTVSDSKLAQIQDVTATAAQLTAAAENVTEGIDTFGELIENLVDDTLSLSGKAADAAKTGEELSNLKSDLNTFLETGKSKQSLIYHNGYVNTAGKITSYNASHSYCIIPVYIGDIVEVKANPDGAIAVLSYTDTENVTVGNTVTVIMLGSGNTLQDYKWASNKNGYIVISGATATLSATISRNITRNKNVYDLYIAGNNSIHKSEADIVCDGVNDSKIINDAIARDYVHSVFFYPDSTFILNAPIVLKSNLTVKSCGAVFTQGAMKTTTLTYTNTDPTSHLLRVQSVDGFEAGQYLYIADDNGQNMSNVIEFAYGKGNPSITFVNQIDYVWAADRNVVLKTANPCFVIRNISNVVIDGVCIDWNVVENPIQTYNPYFLQEGVSIQYSSNISIKSCKIENGGRRGICTTDSKDITINNCFLKNWHEHGIDIFSGYTDLENPALSNVIITDTIVTDNKMHGIQMHRGSGVIVNNCIAYNNVEANISMAEYAHHNVVSNCLCDTSKVGIIVRTGCHDNLLIGNQILNCSFNGIWIRGTSTYNTENNRVDGNLIDGIIKSGILAEYADRSSIVNNKMRNVSSDMENGVPIQVSLSHYAIIKSNEIERNEVHTLYGIRVAGGTSDYNIINDNIIYNCGAPSYTGQHDVSTNNIVMTIV